MIENERQLITQLFENTLSKEDFLSKFTVDVTINPNYVLELLEVAFKEKNAYDIEYAMLIAFTFNLFTKDFVNILCRLLEEKWHFQHEDITRILQSLKAPEAIEYLYRTALSKFEYLDHNDSSALAVKCIWALGDINTTDSRKKLELLAQVKNEIIRSNAIEQLNRNI
jgi:hypothetical protein